MPAMLTPIALLQGHHRRHGWRAASATSSTSPQAQIKAPINNLGLTTARAAAPAASWPAWRAARCRRRAQRDHQQPAARRLRHRPVRVTASRRGDKAGRRAPRAQDVRSQCRRGSGAICAFLCAAATAATSTTQNIPGRRREPTRARSRRRRAPASQPAQQPCTLRPHGLAHRDRASSAAVERMPMVAIELEPWRRPSWPRRSLHDLAGSQRRYVRGRRRGHRVVHHELHQRCARSGHFELCASGP